MQTAFGYGEKKTKNIRTEKYRSKFEENFAKKLKELKLEAYYEKEKIQYVVPETTKTYTPDWVIGKHTYIETKGRFTATDRAKQLLVRKCNPKATVYLLFQNPNVTLTKKSKTTYAMWCDKHDIPWADIKDEKTWRKWFKQ